MLVRFIKRLPQPSFFADHFFNLDWRSLGLEVNLVNLVRHPISRIASYFYYTEQRWKRRHPDQQRHSNFSDCVLNGEERCLVGGSRDEIYGRVEMLLSYFCGQAIICTDPESKDALAIAQRAVDNEYSVVGILEQLNVTLAVMELLLPLWFHGSRTFFEQHRIIENKNPHPEPSAAAVKILGWRLRHDIEFYQFIEQRLHWQYARLQDQKSKMSSSLPSIGGRD